MNRLLLACLGIQRRMLPRRCKKDATREGRMVIVVWLDEKLEVLCEDMAKLYDLKVRLVAECKAEGAE